ncbi:MAG: hypothetical protein A2Y55_13425 [Actinobacteria bacterium RBG_16_68_12]|nr:MAG: hypothetical protein A2Y55_13425 [Actinobacteria bacterium RBG_16_68_12]
MPPPPWEVRGGKRLPIKPNRYVLAARGSGCDVFRRVACIGDADGLGIRPRCAEDSNEQPCWSYVTMLALARVRNVPLSA